MTETEQTATEQTVADWEVVTHPRVQRVIGLVGKAIGRSHADVTTADDAEQEATLWCASNGNLVRSYLADPDEDHGNACLYTRCRQRVSDSYRRAVRAASRTESREELHEIAAGMGW